MTTRIAFLSCTRMGFKDTSDLPTTHADYPCKIKDRDFDQPIWAQLTQIHAAQPFQAILFLGDQIYSDYWPWNGGGDRPKDPSWTADRFHAHMYKMYKTQYENATGFKQFVQALHASGAQIGMTWDDHDFGYNKSYGKDPVFQPKLESAKLLFEQFLNVIKTAPPIYPPCQPLIGAVPTVGIEQIATPIALNHNTEVLMLDSRFYRESAAAGAQFLGTPQWTQLQTRLNSNTTRKLQIVCSGSPYSMGGESWQNGNAPMADFVNFNNIVGARDFKTLFLSGDIHKNAYAEHANGKLCEVISSGAANVHAFKWPIFADGNFGVLSIEDTTIQIDFYERGQRDQKLSRPPFIR